MTGGGEGNNNSNEDSKDYHIKIYLLIYLFTDLLSDLIFLRMIGIFFSDFNGIFFFWEVFFVVDGGLLL